VGRKSGRNSSANREPGPPEAGRSSPRKVVIQHRNRARGSDRQGARMKWLIWALLAVAIAIGLILLAGKSDFRRFQRMRRM